MSKRKLKLEIKEEAAKVLRAHAESQLTVNDGKGVILITPDINEDYWLARVPLSDKQAVVCFPKFGTIGIGFQVEEDWNTNLPYSCDTETIYKHIQHNKGSGFRHTTCMKAIKLLQTFATEYMSK